MATSKDQGWLKLRENLSPAQLIDLLRQLFRRIFDRLDALDLRGTGVVVPDESITTSKLADSAVTPAKVAASVAGNGLAGGGGSALAVNVDNSTLEISSDTVRQKDSGTTGAKLSATVQAAIQGTPAFVVGAEAGNVINVDVQLKDINATALSAGYVVMAWLSSSAGGAVTATAPDTSAAIGTDGLIIQEIQTRKQWWVKCHTNGQFDLNLGHAAGAGTWYLNLAGADGRVHSSGAITFA